MGGAGWSGVEGGGAGKLVVVGCYWADLPVL